VDNICLSRDINHLSSRVFLYSISSCGLFYNFKSVLVLLQVYGEIESTNGVEKFEFSHSYSEVHHPPDVIRPDGIFMSFQHYNVEIRKRVKCITAKEGRIFESHLKLKKGTFLTK